MNCNYMMTYYSLGAANEGKLLGDHVKREMLTGLSEEESSFSRKSQKQKPDVTWKTQLYRTGNTVVLEGKGLSQGCEECFLLPVSKPLFIFLPRVFRVRVLQELVVSVTAPDPQSLQPACPKSIAAETRSTFGQVSCN